MRMLRVPVHALRVPQSSRVRRYRRGVCGAAPPRSGGFGGGGWVCCGCGGGLGVVAGGFVAGVVFALGCAGLVSVVVGAKPGTVMCSRTLRLPAKLITRRRAAVRSFGVFAVPVTSMVSSLTATTMFESFSDESLRM